MGSSVFISILIVFNLRVAETLVSSRKSNSVLDPWMISQLQVSNVIYIERCNTKDWSIMGQNFKHLSTPTS